MHVRWKRTSAVNLAAAVLTDGVLFHATINLLNRWHVSCRAKSWPFIFVFFYTPCPYLPILMTPKWKLLVDCLTFVPAGVGRQMAEAEIPGNRLGFSWCWHRFVGEHSSKTHARLEIRGVGLKLKWWYERGIPSNDANDPPQLPTYCCRSTARWSWQTSVWRVSWPTRTSRGKPLWGPRSGWLQRSSSSLPTTPR